MLPDYTMIFFCIRYDRLTTITNKHENFGNLKEKKIVSVYIIVIWIQLGGKRCWVYVFISGTRLLEALLSVVPFLDIDIPVEAGEKA